MFHHYRRLIALRHDDPVVRLGDFALVAPEHPHVYAFTRSGDGPTLFVAGNFTGDPQQVEIAGVEPASAELVIGNYDDAPDVAGGVLRLRPVGGRGAACESAARQGRSWRERMS